MTHYSRKAIHGVSIIFLMGILSNLFSYLLRLLLARNLTIEEYGLVYAIVGFFGFFSIFQDFGLGEALVKFTAEFKAQNKLKEIKSAIITVFSFQLLGSLLLGGFAIIFANWLAIHHFHTPEAGILVTIYAISIILSPTINIFKSIFPGFQEMRYLSIIDFSKMLFVVGCTYLFLTLGWGIKSV